jgi:CTP synthase (UTP-ammonia lyase)
VLRVGVVGDYNGGNETHLATDAALVHASAALGTPVMGTWVGTERIASGGVGELDGFDCLVISPGSPYRSLEGALGAIHHARTSDIPVLGTCGGFQHMVLELARNVLGYPDADHAELSPDAARLFITPLVCSLAGQTMAVSLVETSKAAAAYRPRRRPSVTIAILGSTPSTPMSSRPPVCASPAPAPKESRA